MLVGADVPPRVGLFQTITTKAAGCTGGPIHIFGALTADTPWSPGCNTVYIIDGSVDFPAGGRGDVDGSTRGDGQGGQWSTDRELFVACFDHADQSGCVSAALAAADFAAKTALLTLVGFSGEPHVSGVTTGPAGSSEAPSTAFIGYWHP